MNIVHPTDLSESSSAARAEDVTLARRAALGDERAFDQIMRRYNQRLFRLAVSVAGESSEAEDILQESYVRAFYRLGTFSGDGELGAWLARIVRNEAIDRLRTRGSRRRHIALETDLYADEDTVGIAGMARAEEVDFSPEIAVERADVERILEEAIGVLPVQFRTVFMLREVEGLSVEETATYLGIPPATVKTRDHRARTLLRAHLSKKMDGALSGTYRFLGARCNALVDRVLERVRVKQ
jgi:RNA polymerase sigma-70 factor (ECF subfamily)